MTQEKFREIYAEYKSSGMSIASYCSLLGYHKSTFYIWQNKWPYIKSENINEDVLSPITLTSPQESAMVIPSQDLPSIQPFKPSLVGTSAESIIEIHHPTGLQIKLTGKIDTQALTTILNRL